jgi:hypothetical protein
LARWANQLRIWPPTGLRSGRGVVVVVDSCCSGGGCVEVEASLSGGSYVEVKASLGGGDGSGHTMDPVMGDPQSGSLAPDLGARVLVCLPCAPTWILAVCLGVDLGGESSTDMISMGSSSSSSSTAVTPSPPSLGLGDERSIRLDAIG